MTLLLIAPLTLRLKGLLLLSSQTSLLWSQRKFDPYLQTLLKGRSFRDSPFPLSVQLCPADRGERLQRSMRGRCGPSSVRAWESVPVRSYGIKWSGCTSSSQAFLPFLLGWSPSQYPSRRLQRTEHGRTFRPSGVFMVLQCLTVLCVLR